MSDFRDALTRKREHVEEMLGFLKEEGSVKASDRNSVIADGEAGWEMGQFDDKDDSKPFDERRDGFIIRTRRDALTTVLNTSDSLDALTRIEEKLSKAERRLERTEGWVWALIVLVGLMFYRSI